MMMEEEERHSDIFSTFCTTSQHVGCNWDKMREWNWGFKKKKTVGDMEVNHEN